MTPYEIGVDHFFGPEEVIRRGDIFCFNLFEMDARHITPAMLTELAREGKIGFNNVEEVKHNLEINPDKADPLLVW